MRALLAFLAAVPARSLHSTPPPRRRTSRLHATEWQAALDDIDGDAWRDLRRELYGAPDAAPPSTLARFETYCERRRASLEEEVIEDLGGRRLLECQQNYPDLEAKPIWDVAACVEIKLVSVVASARWRGVSTPSTRRCRRGSVGSMAWRFTKVHAIT